MTINHMCRTGNQDAGDRRGVVRVLLASTADIQPSIGDPSTDQHVSSYRT